MCNDDEVVGRLLKDNVEFKKMKELHEEYERHLEAFNKKSHLTDEEMLEKKKLKKKKLAVKDKMKSIMRASC